MPSRRSSTQAAPTPIPVSIEIQTLVASRVRARRWALLTACALAAASLPALADSAPADPTNPSPGWTGTATLGPLILPKYEGGTRTQTWLIPILSVNYNDTVYVEFDRAGVYLLASDDKKMGLGLAVEPRFGFGAGDGARVAGFATRRSSLEAGPTFDWDLDVVAISVARLGDVNRTSRGASIKTSFYVPLRKDDRIEIGALAAFDTMDRKIADYYFGVRSSEATAARAEYHPGGGTHTSIGISGTFKVERGRAFTFAVVATRLAGSAAASPIAETRRATLAYAGYGLSF